MSGNIVEHRRDAVDRIILMSLLFVFAGACSKDSTSPTPTASAVAITAGAAQTATVGTALAAPVVVKVTDQSGNALAGVAVTFTPSAPSGTVSAGQVTTDATGLAQVNWTLGTVAGADSMFVAVGLLSPLTVVATAIPDAPATIAIVAGNDQSALAGTALGTALSVKVTDRYGNAVPNAVVQWSDDAGGVLTTTTTVTDANGIAQDGYTLGPTAGTDDVTATIMVNGTPTAMATSFVELAN